MVMTANKGIFNLSDVQEERNEELRGGRGSGHPQDNPHGHGDVVSRFGRSYFVAEVIPKQLCQTINPIFAPRMKLQTQFPFEQTLKAVQATRNRLFTCLLTLSDSQVIYRSLPKWESLDPFGDEGQQQLKVTNIRIRLLRHQQCPCQAKDLTATHKPLPTQHFAIYDLIVKGSCSCNGHAEQCVPALGYQPIRDRTNHVVRTVRQFYKCRKIDCSSLLTRVKYCAIHLA